MLTEGRVADAPGSMSGASGVNVRSTTEWSGPSSSMSCRLCMKRRIVSIGEPRFVTARETADNCGKHSQASWARRTIRVITALTVQMILRNSLLTKSTLSANPHPRCRSRTSQPLLHTAWMRGRLWQPVKLRRWLAMLLTRHVTWTLRQRGWSKNSADCCRHSSFLALLINVSFITGCFPAKYKHAVVSPLLKKGDADKNELKNYRPVLNLPLIETARESRPDTVAAIFNCLWQTADTSVSVQTIPQHWDGTVESV